MVFEVCELSPSQSETPVSHGSIQSLLLKFSAQELIEVRQTTLGSSSASSSSSSSSTIVIAVDHTKLWAMIGTGAGAQRSGVKRKAEDPAQHKRTSGLLSSSQSSAPPPPHSSSTSLTLASSLQLAGQSAPGSSADKKGRNSKGQSSHLDMEIESLLNQQSTKEQQSKKVGTLTCRFAREVAAGSS